MKINKEIEIITKRLENTKFQVEDRIGIVNNPLKTVLIDDEILFHSSPKEFNFDDLIYRLTNQSYATRNGSRKSDRMGISEHEACEELIKILKELKRVNKINQIL